MSETCSAVSPSTPRLSASPRFPGMPALPGAAFLRAPGSTNDHDLGLFGIGLGEGASAAGRGTVGLYHLAWEVDTLADLAETR